MYIKPPTHAECVALLNGCARELISAVFDVRNKHMSLLPERHFPSHDVAGIVHDIVALAAQRAVHTGSLAYVQTFYVQFPGNSFEAEVPLHFENAFVLAMTLHGVHQPRATVTLEFERVRGGHYLQVRLAGLVVPQ